MQCDNEFCIYRAASGCRLDTIALDVLGKCTSCIYVDIDEATLQRYRQI